MDELINHEITAKYEADSESGTNKDFRMIGMFAEHSGIPLPYVHWLGYPHCRVARSRCRA